MPQLWIQMNRVGKMKLRNIKHGGKHGTRQNPV